MTEDGCLGCPAAAAAAALGCLGKNKVSYTYLNLRGSRIENFSTNKQLGTLLPPPSDILSLRTFDFFKASDGKVLIIMGWKLL